jgi:hypothetical protein
MEYLTTEEAAEQKLPKNSKENRYYYRNREAILERQRLARLAKKGVDVTKLETLSQIPLEERRKKKMEHLGLLKVDK